MVVLRTVTEDFYVIVLTVGTGVITVRFYIKIPFSIKFNKDAFCLSVSKILTHRIFYLKKSRSCAII